MIPAWKEFTSLREINKYSANIGAEQIEIT